ncbi:hypothetical protein PRIPAC_87177 [Pristionchus pacificus]|uniref:Uncharacterized protein n=1 Tax=Pristionchus pacificus TaxID=54126 RepID=A0A2A6CXM8_PRIPA|nr:hypothetical protein PRIPAC_87177 [Pristionchus pacificus]|eukprot:PDM82888.1 hypothetical protein PRIPAC_37281 [Pristionchus pacificus]
MPRQCCCGILSHKTGARLVASSMIIYDIIMTVLEFVIPPTATPVPAPSTTGVVGSDGFSLKEAFVRAVKSVSTGVRIASTLAFVLDIIATIQLFLGCRKNKSILLVPMLIITILWVILHTLSYLAVLIAPELIKDLNARSTGPPIVAKTLFWAIDVIFIIWIFTVVKECYTHIRDIERPRRRNREELEMISRF